ncbi:MAG: SDR family oxidoreductase [Myxococcota bacterium]
MRPPLDGSIVITGASAGIGEALAAQVAGRARRLWLVARREDRLQALAQRLRADHAGLQVEVVPCDLAQASARERLVERLLAAGPLDVLINNAGFGDQNLLEHARWDRLEQMLAVNVVALTHLTQRLLPAMVERGRGGVLNISSGFGLSWMPGLAVYVGTKHYVTGLSEALRAEVAPRGVVVTQVCPGPVRTEFHGLTHNTTGQRSPGFAYISADQCAAEALAGFERNRAIVVPGVVIRNLLRLYAVTPRWLWRRLAQRMVGRLRVHAQREHMASLPEPEGEGMGEAEGKSTAKGEGKGQGA